jgi:hypothetical protein
MLAVDADVATVVDRHGAAVSTLTLAAIRTAAVADLGGTATLRQAEA